MHIYMRNFFRMTLVPFCLAVALDGSVVAGEADEIQALVKSRDHAILSGGTPPAVEECERIIVKSAAGSTLTPREGDQLILCHVAPPLPGNGGTGPGFQALQPPPNLYDMQDFHDLPGILGGGEVQG